MNAKQSNSRENRIESQKDVLPAGLLQEKTLLALHEIRFVLRRRGNGSRCLFAPIARPVIGNVTEKELWRNLRRCQAVYCAIPRIVQFAGDVNMC